MLSLLSQAFICIQVLLLYVVFELVRRFTLTTQQYFLEKNEEEGQS